MAGIDIISREIETYRNGSITADIVQQGTGNAARDVNNSIRRPQPAPSSTIPFRRDDNFIARASLDSIQQECAKPAGCAALVGLGGVGKSQIAIEYTYRVRDASPTTWAFWVHAGTQARFREGYRRIAEATKMDGWDNPQADVLRLVRSWLCDECNGRWTMVVDNADDANVIFSPVPGAEVASTAGPSQVVGLLSDFLPQSRNGSILVTSRSRDVAYRLTGSHASIFEVGPMGEDDALALLQSKLGILANADKAHELLHALDLMPLAITQAAAFIAQRAPRMTVARYLDELRKGDRGRAELLKQDVGDSRRDGQASNSIIATWQISFEHIRREAPAAARLLSLMSFFDRQGIPESLLRDQYALDQGEEEDDFDDDISMLISYSLVGISSADGSEFEMHRLVQYSTKKWLELCSELDAWKAKYTAVMKTSYPKAGYDNWRKLQAMFPHAQAVVDCRPVEGEVTALKNWASVLDKVAWYANETGQHAIAKEMLQSALEVRQKVLGFEHPDTLSSMNNLAVTLKTQGDYEEAEAMIRQTLAQRDKILGPKHPDTLTSMNNLASVLSSQRKYEEAEAIYRQTLAQRNKILGPEHPDTLIGMHNLASVLSNQRKDKEAEVMYRQTLAQRNKILGPEHPQTLTSMHNLAFVLSRQRKYEEAEVMLRQTLAQRNKILGPEHPDTLKSMYFLAIVHTNQEWYEESFTLYERACTAFDKVLGADHATTHRCHRDYSEAQACSGQARSHISAEGLESSCKIHTLEVRSVLEDTDFIVAKTP